MTNSIQAPELLHWAQTQLEEFYGAQTGLDVRHFIKTIPNLTDLGRMHIEQNPSDGDIDLALFFDRDFFSAWKSSESLERRSLSVLFEETSHFVYLGFNHRRNRNISQLEMELQSEVDRILLSFHPQAPWGNIESRKTLSDEILNELHTVSYPESGKEIYETARRWASLLIRRIGRENPIEWNEKESTLLRKFFHLDLGEKIHLLRSLQESHK